MSPSCKSIQNITGLTKQMLSSFQHLGLIGECYLFIYLFMKIISRSSPAEFGTPVDKVVKQLL